MLEADFELIPRRERRIPRLYAIAFGRVFRPALDFASVGAFESGLPAVSDRPREDQLPTRTAAGQGGRVPKRREAACDSRLPAPPRAS